MKIITGTLISILILITVSHSAYSQSGPAEPERMQRDIRIMERALEEMFTLEGVSSSPIYRLGDAIRVGGAVNGTYLPGFGIIFSIPDRSRYTVNAFSDQGESRFLFDGESAMVEETVSERMVEFLIHYAPAIGQLEPDEQVLVLFGADFGSRGGLFGFTMSGINNRFRLASTRDEEAGELPVISMSAIKSDMNDLRSGRISESQFRERIHKTVKNRMEHDRKLDLQIFSGILETGLSEQRPPGYFAYQEEPGTSGALTVNRSPAYLYLDNFGVIYQLELTAVREILRPVGLPERLGRVIQNIGANLDTVRVRERELRSNTELEQYRRELEEAHRNAAQHYRETLEENERVRREAILEQRLQLRESLDRHLDKIKTLMLDYGHTLSSLNGGQSMLISVHLNLPGSLAGDEIPNRVDLRLAKAELDRLEQGSLTQEAVMERIVVKKY